MSKDNFRNQVFSVVVNLSEFQFLEQTSSLLHCPVNGGLQGVEVVLWQHSVLKASSSISVAYGK